MLPKMRYRLGLDIGTTSIGWCLIRLNKSEEPIAIIRMGTRIFSDSRNPKDGSSLAVTRREARQARRRRDRLLKRKQRMLNALINHQFFPQEENKRQALVNLDPYALRKKGLYQTLTGEEFARALFHINQRRGFLSNRKTDKNDNESGALKSAIKTLREKLIQEDCKTLGEWLANRHEKGESVRARLHGKTQKDRAYDFYADRAMVEHEFNELWSKQSSFNPSLFNEKAKEELKDILLFQRPLKPVKPGRCTLLPEEERAPLALPSTQRFRIYQEVNNLRIITGELKEQPLTLEQRDAVVELLEQGDATFKTKIKKALNLSGTVEFNLEDIKRDRLKGNRTSIILSRKELFSKQWHTFTHDQQDEIVDHLLHEESLGKLVDWLCKKTNIDESTAELIANTNLPEGYGSLSKKALNHILPELEKDVIPYSTAVEKAGFESHSALSHAHQTGEIMEQLPYYGIPLRRHVAFEKDEPKNDEERYGKIANPTVHIGLNEIRKVVNAIIKRYGHPSEIIVEVTRELKLNRERKNEIQREQKLNQDRNEENIKEACIALGLNPNNLDKSKRRELSQKMQLWKELNPKDAANRRCPYSGEQISINKLLSSEIEIEHILPYSITLDDSLNNKTVSTRRANRDKGNKTPYDAFGKQALEGYDYNLILERAALMPKAKSKRFTTDGYQQWLRNDKDFLARALNDTAYLSRIAKEYLSCVCPPNMVRAIPGRMTALLRGKYGLNDLLSNDDHKNRDDHRHHAVDAAVVAITDQGLLQRFSKASAYARQHQLNKLVDEMPYPWPTFRADVQRGLNNIYVSHKPDHGYQGAMHEASAWGINKEGMATRSVKPEDGSIKQRETKNQKLVMINSSNNKTRHDLNEDGETKAYKGYVGGSNYCLEILRDEKGKWNGDVVSTFQAYQIIREMGEDNGFRQLRNPLTSQAGNPLVMRLMINDYVRLNVGDTTRTMRVAKISGNGQIFLSEHNEANVDARNRDKNEPFSYISKMAGSLQKAKGRRVTVSEIGELRDPGYKS
ncbi:MAG: type II CRISPR RNA-guided endonuclease Cas9 [Gammaproteobacteria bacterium]|nr:type II CRISPR RNA-guided endonuclease Cas9 [Gammaproteobacteria bacterium]